MSEKDELDLYKWLPATVLNEKDLDEMRTDVLVIGSKHRSPQHDVMESVDPQYRKNRAFSCLVRVTSHTDPIVGPPSVAITPAELLLDNLHQWGVWPKPNNEEKES